MRINSPQAIRNAQQAFRSHNNSWDEARRAGRRDHDGVLVISYGRGQERQPPPAPQTNSESRNG